MAYTSMKKIIMNENAKYKNELITAEEYELWKINTQNKLDVFFACSRLTQAQYEELCGMLLTPEADSSSTEEAIGQFAVLIRGKESVRY